MGVEKAKPRSKKCNSLLDGFVGSVPRPLYLKPVSHRLAAYIGTRAGEGGLLPMSRVDMRTTNKVYHIVMSEVLAFHEFHNRLSFRGERRVID